MRSLYWTDVEEVGHAPRRNGKIHIWVRGRVRKIDGAPGTVGNPEISLYLKEIPPDLLSDLGPELKKVLDFRQKIIEGKKILYEQFKDGDDFAEKIERCIAAHVPRDRALASAKRELQKGN